MTENLSPVPAPTPLQDRPVVVLVGNPRAGSRTLDVAELTAGLTATRLGLDGPLVTIDLAALAGSVLTGGDDVDAALRTLTGARLAIVATPVYKGSYTGLLKAFLDRLPAGGLAGVTTVPLVVSAAPQHAAAGKLHLVPLLDELGAVVPTRTLSVLEAEIPDADRVVARWLDDGVGALSRAVHPAPEASVVPEPALGGAR